MAHVDRHAVSGTLAMQNYSRITREPDRFERQRRPDAHRVQTAVNPEVPGVWGGF
jgi:hypothetical protein